MLLPHRNISVCLLSTLYTYVPGGHINTHTRTHTEARKLTAGKPAGGKGQEPEIYQIVPVHHAGNGNVVCALSWSCVVLSVWHCVESREVYSAVGSQMFHICVKRVFAQQCECRGGYHMWAEGHIFLLCWCAHVRSACIFYGLLAQLFTGLFCMLLKMLQPLLYRSWSEKRKCLEWDFNQFQMLFYN